MKKFYSIAIFVLITNLLLTNTVLAQASWTGAINNNWSNPGNWSTAAVPSAGTTVTIPNSATKTALTVDATASCASLTISGGVNNFTLTIATGQKLTVNGTLTIQAPSANNIVKSVVLASATSVLTVTTDIILPDVITGNPSTNATLNIGAGTVNLSGNLTMNASAASENILTMSTGKLAIGGTLSPTNGTFTVGTGTVEYNANGAQAMRAASYFKLIVNGSGAKSTAVTVNDSLLVQGTATLGNAVTYSTAVLAYKGTSAQTVGANEFPTPMTTPVVIDNTGGVTIGATKTLNADLTILSGTLSAGTNLTMGANTAINRSGGSMTGTIQGNNAYDVFYTGGSFSTSGELSGTGLRSIDITQTTSTDVVTLSQSWAPDGDVAINNGILDIGAFTLNRSVNGGTFTINTGSTLRIGGTNGLPTNWNAYSIDNTDGTVEFNGSNQAVAAPPGQNYTILILSGSGTKTISAGNTVRVLLSVQGSGVTVAGTIPAYLAPAVLEYKGTGSQTTGIEFGGTGANPTNVTIDNTSGVTLSAAKLINGVLTLTSGYLTTTSTNLLTLGTAATAPTPAGYINGPLAKNTNTNGATFTFPVGKLGRGIIRNVGIVTTSANASTFTAEFFNANPKTTFSSSLGAIDQISNCEYWDVARTSGTATGRVVLSWPAVANNCGSTSWGYIGNTATLLVAHFTGGAWVNEGLLGGSITGTAGAGGTITCNTNLNSFSPFTLGTSNGLQNPLPVKFANVKAFQRNAGVQVEWTNLTEKDVTRYVVERSANGISFSPVAELLARGNQNNAEQYTAYDARPVAGANFYRVTAIEITGKTIYSNIMKVDMGQQDKVVSLYPNPVKNHQVNFTFSSQRGVYNISVFNSNGQVVYSKQLQHEGGAVTQMIELPASVKTGVYNLKVSGDGFNSSKPFIVQ